MKTWAQKMMSNEKAPAAKWREGNSRLLNGAKRKAMLNGLLKANLID
jgi:hypothetical protein